MRLTSKIFFILSSAYLLILATIFFESRYLLTFNFSTKLQILFICYAITISILFTCLYFFILFLFFKEKLKQPLSSFQLKEIEQKINYLNTLSETNLKLLQELRKHKTKKLKQKFKNDVSNFGHYDRLTALPNRILFNEILNKAIRDAKRHHKLLAVLFINLDNFKTINEKIGFKYGNIIIKKIAFRFTNSLRVSDVLARLSGDEFVILLNDINHAKFAGSIAKKLLQVCATPIKIKSNTLTITASIGICVFPIEGISLEDIERKTDIAMLNAKTTGGNNYQFYTQIMNKISQEHTQLESIVRIALQDKKLMLYYQPQIHLSSGIVTRVEALIRLEHPKLGVINPSDFIPLAEEIGLITQIGDWALYEACRVCKMWHDKGYKNIIVAVNISAKHFYQFNILKTVAKALNDNNLEARFLEIEITETAIMKNVEAAINTIKNLASMGIHISIDDFGTGYASINYLKQFPVSILKIDQSFIKNIPGNKQDQAITSAIITLSHQLGLEVVAEGVETAEQMQFLTDHHCDFVQGYFFSRPLPENKIIEVFML